MYAKPAVANALRPRLLSTMSTAPVRGNSATGTEDAVAVSDALSTGDGVVLGWVDAVFGAGCPLEVFDVCWCCCCEGAVLGAEGVDWVFGFEGFCGVDGCDGVFESEGFDGFCGGIGVAGVCVFVISTVALSQLSGVLGMSGVSAQTVFFREPVAPVTALAVSSNVADCPAFNSGIVCCHKVVVSAPALALLNAIPFGAVSVMAIFFKVLSPEFVTLTR